MANANKQGQGQGGFGGKMGNAGKDAGPKPFGGGGSEESQPGLDEDEGSDQGYDIDVEGPTKKDASTDSWRDRPETDSNKPRR